MGVSENRGPSYSTLNSRILFYKDPKISYPLIFGNSQISFKPFRLIAASQELIKDWKVIVSGILDGCDTLLRSPCFGRVGRL